MAKITPVAQGQHPSPWKQICLFWKAWVLILTPILLLPLPILHPSRAGMCAYGTLIMAIYWMTEAIPMAATALLPIALFPWLGVLSAKDLSRNYLKDTNMLFVGGLMVAVAVEKWNLHKRIALRVLLLVGSHPRWLMFGFMVTTAFLSMWISNTATTAMMVPIAQAVLSELESQNPSDTDQIIPRNLDSKEIDEVVKQETDHDIISEMRPLAAEENDTNGSVLEQIHTHTKGIDSFINTDNSAQLSSKSSDYKYRDLCKGLTLCVAYAANIGGTATLTGTGPNVVIRGQLDILFEGKTGVTFSSWFIYSFPNMLLSLTVAWIWLQVLFLGPRVLFCWRKSNIKENAAKKVIQNEYDKLGPLSFAEIAVLCHFVLLAVLWITREPEFVPGWAELFTDGYITDACVAITISVALFMCPSQKPKFLCWHKKNDPEPPGPSAGLLDWETVHRKLSWSVVLVLGGGFALADACKESGLSSAIAEVFSGLVHVPPWLLILALCVITATFTEITSNVATATIFLPILAEVARTIHINPLYLMIPVTISTSFAFMLPVATPPNAIVFAYGHMRVWDMVKAGILMNIMCILVVTLSINTWGYAYFNLGHYPSWADPPGNNSTAGVLDILSYTITTSNP